ncbi:MAG: hypothetical protein ACXVEF_06720 [Polyangiales bacterium]
MDIAIHADAFLSTHKSELEEAIVDALHDGVRLDDIVVLAVDPTSAHVPDVYLGSEIGTLDRTDAIEELSEVAPSIAESLARAPESPGVHVIAIVHDQIVLCRFDVSCVRHAGAA